MKKNQYAKESILEMNRVSSYAQDVEGLYMDSYLFGKYPKVSKNIKEPIEWILLDVDNKKKQALLLSKYILDLKCYDDSGYYGKSEKQMSNEGKTSYWEISSLRKWLNKDFFNKTFTATEKKKIVNTKLYTDGFISTDKVFLLDLKDVKKYFKQKDMLDENSRLTTKGTPYAKEVNNLGEKLWVPDYESREEGYSNFWLRSKAKIKFCVNSVKPFGGLEIEGRMQNDKCVGVRPAMWIRIDASEFSKKKKEINKKYSALQVQAIEAFDRFCDKRMDYLDDEDFGLLKIVFSYLKKKNNK